MKKETPIKVQLYVIYEKEYLKNPIRLTVYPSHTPSLMLQKGIDALRLPKTMRTQNPQRLYHLTKKAFLEDKMSYKQQKVKTGDYVVLTDYTDMNLLEAVVNAISPPITESHQENRIKIVFRGFLKGIPWIGIGIDAIFFGKD